jgi:serine/threonine protein kinase
MNSVYLYKEIEALKKLDHPNIIKLLNYFQIDGDEIALLLEYAEGGTIKKYMKSVGKLNEDEAKSIVIKLLETLEYCHGKEIIHRDLKPENIMYSDNEKIKIKIIDFGIAGLCQRETIGAGTARYLPPEVISGNDYESRPQIDCWAVGCITYELLTGEKLFKGESYNEIKVNIKYLFYIFYF